MARWDPGTEDRLKSAALDLFAEHGYDNVTVTQIAERAGITRRSYFRYFPDKREVLFGGSEHLPPALAGAVRASAQESLPAIAVDAVRQVGMLLVSRVERTAERRAVIASSPELQERERTKAAAMTDALCAALAERGPADEARRVARLTAVFFQEALERWIDTGEDFSACLDVAVTSVRAAAAAFPESVRP
ncbi:TetR/AcrR family transcriptional regulator [Lentzea sp. NPDC060358]|uniref:TetR/AcrR family transcriptional regulator n=1 Tax=Lentzea sp. NPDC060358 TaxID=3347103 RepID=UPI0036579B8C